MALSTKAAMSAFERHLAAIQSGNVTKTNVIGIRKAIKATDRRAHGYSVGVTAPKITRSQVRELQSELAAREPLVRGDLHASGVRILTALRWRKRLEPIKPVLDTLHGFRLVRFETVEREGHYGRIESVQPVYRAVGTDGSFLFMNVPWQSGGDGPEILED